MTSTWKFNNGLIGVAAVAETYPGIRNILHPITPAEAFEIVTNAAFNNAGSSSYADMRTGGAADDDLLLMFATNDAGNPVTPTGWTELASDIDATPEAWIGYKVMATADTSSTDIEPFSGQDDASGVYVVISNAGTPVVNTAYEGSSSTYTFNNITATAGSLLFACVHLDDDKTAEASWQATSGNGWVRLNVGGGVNASGSSSNTAVYWTTAAGGAENPGTITESGDEYRTQIVEVPEAV